MFRRQQTTEVPFAPCWPEQKYCIAGGFLTEGSPGVQREQLSVLPSICACPSNNWVLLDSPRPITFSPPPATGAMGVGECMGSCFPGALGNCSLALGRRLALFQRYWMSRDELQKQLQFS